MADPRFPSVRLPPLTEQLKATRWSDEQQVAHCDKVAILVGLREDTTPRLLAQAQVPMVSTGRLFITDWGGKTSRHAEVPVDELVGVVVRDVPQGQPVAFSSRRGKALTNDLTALLAQFIPYVLPRVGLAGKSDDVLISIACKEGLKAAVDAQLPAIALVETRAQVFSPISDDAVTEIMACSGATCAAQPDATTRAQFELTPKRGITGTLLVEFSGGVGLSNDPWALGAEEFQPVGGVDGPDQIFELQPRRDAPQAFSTALLLGARIGHVRILGKRIDDTLLAFGPSLLVGTGGGTLTQWNLRLGKRILGGPYLTGGVSLRLVQAAADYAPGQRLSVARPSPGADPSPPQFRKHSEPRWMFSLGLALDLEGLGKDVSSVVKAFGGDK